MSEASSGRQLGNSLRRIALLAVTAFLCAAPLLASEGAEHGAEPFFTRHRLYWLINLVVFLAILFKAAGPAVVRFLEEKQAKIAHDLAEAERRRAEAQSVEARIAGQIAELRREVEELAARAERDGERERDEILAEAVRERERIRSSVHAEIAQGVRQAHQELTAHAARVAAGLAGRRLESGLTRDDKKRLFRDNLDRLARKEA